MSSLGSIPLIAIAFFLSWVGAPELAGAQEEPITVTFDLYSAAHATRAAMIDSVVTATAVGFDGEFWRFTVRGIRGGPAAKHEPSEGCRSRSTSPTAGVTGCLLFSASQHERQVMELDGWTTVPPRAFNPETKLWEFAWRREP